MNAFPPQSNRGAWDGSYQAIDQDGSPIDLTSASEITLQVHDDCNSVLSATKTGGTITVSATPGLFSWTFSASQMGALCPKTYTVGATSTVSGSTHQIMLARLPIYEGFVR